MNDFIFALYSVVKIIRMPLVAGLFAQKGH